MRTDAVTSRKGQVDTVDLIAGVVLLILVPVVCLVVAGVFGLTTRSAKFDFREKPVTDPVPDKEEVDMRFRSLQDLYLQNARPFLENVEKQKDPAVRVGFLRWAIQCLEKADSACQELDSLIRKHPESQVGFQGYLTQISQLRADVQRDLGRARELDVLGLNPVRQ